MSQSPRWHYALNGEPVGPVSAAELRRMASEGRITEVDWVCREGWSDWAPAGQVKGLFPAGLGPVPCAPSSDSEPNRRAACGAERRPASPGSSRQALLSEAQVVPDSSRCVQCGICSYNCPMGIDVRAHAWRGQPIHDSHCLTCSECVKRCPRGVLRFDRLALFANR